MNWVKSNPLAVVCIAIIVIALVSFYYPTYTWSSAFRSEMAARSGALSRIQGLQSTSVTVPPPKPELPPMTLNMVVNQAAIARLEVIYKDMEQEYKGIYSEAQQRNMQGHQFMMPGLFPNPADQNTLFRSRSAYVAGFQNLYQALDAGAPPTPLKISEMLDREALAFRRSLLLPAGSGLSIEQQQQLTQRQAEKLEEMYRDKAVDIHVYAPEIVVDERTRTWLAPGPFQMGVWSQGSGRPEPFDIWEGQMQLWVQQDLCQAIMLANDVTADPDGTVIDKPVKRIISMTVDPKYIGVPERGYGWSGALTQEIVTARVTEIQTQLTQKIPTNYTISPTGRASNPLYDVRHATLSVVVDSQKLPALINALGKVNFMTVLSVNIKDVDEYAALREGFYYGPCDAVQVDLKVESLWMREWTAHFMPDDVRYHLGVPPRRWQGYVPLAVRQAAERANQMTLPGATPGMVPGRPSPNTFY